MTAKAAGMETCCGGIIGMGETIDDRLDFALSLRDMEVDSICQFLIRAAVRSRRPKHSTRRLLAHAHWFDLQIQSEISASQVGEKRR